MTRKIKCFTVQCVDNRNTNTIMKSIADVVAQYNKRGFKINVILGDPEFKSIKDQLNKLFGITLNITSKSEHVPEIERGI